MKKLFTLICLFALLIVASCTKETQPKPETQFEMSITQQPVGGINVSTVSTTVLGTIVGTVKPIDVTVEWFVENATHENAFAISTSIIKFTEGTAIAKSSACRVLDPYRHSVYYWLKLTWEDSAGKHVIETDKVFCERK